ncbi:hypothetical protein D9M68_514980 [compost metagenome]
MASAGDDVLPGVAARHGLAAHVLDQFRREWGRREVLDVVDLHVERGASGPALRQRLARGAEAGVHLGQLAGVFVAQVDRELDRAGNHVARAGVEIDHAHGATAVRREVMGDAHDLLHHVGGAIECVAAQRHRRGAGVGFHAGDGHVVPAQAQRAGDYADHLVRRFQHRPLLDMRLEVSAHRPPAHLVGAGIADGLQFVRYPLAFGIGRVQRGLQRENAGEHARAHHHRHEARAFLVGPDGQFERRLGGHAMVVERAHDFQPGQHAEAAIELAPGRLGIDMAAGHHRRQRVVAAGAATEDVADAVHRHGQARVAHPAAYQVAALAVECGQGQPRIAALRRGADLRQVHQRLPQALAVDGDLASHCSSPSIGDWAIPAHAVAGAKPAKNASSPRPMASTS